METKESARTPAIERESHSNSEDCRRGRKTAKKMAVSIKSEDREKKRNDVGDADLT